MDVDLAEREKQVFVPKFVLLYNSQSRCVCCAENKRELLVDGKFSIDNNNKFAYASIDVFSQACCECQNDKRAVNHKKLRELLI